VAIGTAGETACPTLLDQSFGEVGGAGGFACRWKRPNILFVLLDDLGYGQFAPNADMFDLEQLNPIVADRDKKEIAPSSALDAVKSASSNDGAISAAVWRIHQSGHRKRRSPA